MMICNLMCASFLLFICDPQSVSFTEGLRTSASPSSADASFYSVPTSPLALRGLPDFRDSSGSLSEPQAPDTKRPAAERSSTAVADGNTRRAQSPGPPAPPPCQGVGFCHVVRSCSPSRPVGQSRDTATDPDAGGAGGERRAAGKSDHGGGGGLTVGLSPTKGEHPHGRQGSGGGGGPVFTLTNARLQVSEEFIDDDPADISFFAGGSEAFSFPYCALAPQAPPCGHPNSTPSSPDRYPPGVIHMHVEHGFEFEGEDGFGGNVHPSDTSELFEVKAQASLMQSLLSASETSSLRNNQSENSSLSNLPLHSGLSVRTPSSANQSEASSMANFPACSVRSEASSAFQLSDIIDQLEQLSYPPTTAEDSSSTDTDSWGAEAGAPLDMSLFFSNPFAQTGGERVLFDLQTIKNMTPGERVDKHPS